MRLGRRLVLLTAVTTLLGGPVTALAATSPVASRGAVPPPAWVGRPRTVACPRRRRGWPHWPAGCCWSAPGGSACAGHAAPPRCTSEQGEGGHDLTGRSQAEPV